MIVGTISDLHFDMHDDSEEVVKKFVNILSKIEIDVLLIAGDITENVETTINIVDCINEKLPFEVYYVPGNHDIWNKQSKFTTKAIYEQYKQHDRCLVNKVKQVKGYNIVGDIFWYDYSYANKNKYSNEQLEEKQLNDKRWKDKLYVNWKSSDKLISEQMNAKLMEKIEKLDGQKTILVSHMINHPKFCVPVENREIWGYFNAFLGSKSLYDIIKKHNIKLAICGHVHYRKTINQQDTTFICSCLGYRSEWKLFDNADTSFEYQVNKALKIIQLK